VGEVTKNVTVRQKKSFARAEVLAALVEAHGSVSHAAAALGTSPATIHRRLQRDEELRRELDEALERVVDEARARARLLLTKALDALERALEEPRRAPAATRALLEVVRATEPEPPDVLPFSDPEAVRTLGLALNGFSLRLANWIEQHTGRPRAEVLALYREIIAEVVAGLRPGVSRSAARERRRLFRAFQLGVVDDD
jgi:AcrR family transcriptional regulator